MKKFRVSLELTNHCNFKCLICPHDKPDLFTRPLGFISDSIFQRAIDQCNRYADTVEFGFFGEQLLHPKYHHFLELLKNRNFKIAVNTNLSLCTYETFHTWKNIGVEDVRLSLDASCPETFNRCRPGVIYDLRGQIPPPDTRFRAINEKVAYWLALPNHGSTRLVFVKSSHNQNERELFINIWQERLKSKDHILFKQVVSYGGKIADSFVQPGQCSVWENNYFVIGYDGTTSPCNLDINLALRLGNIQYKSMPELYTAGKYLQRKTGCGKDITPCRTCVDANNWSQNEKVFGL
jgi:hypothetical protein